MNFKNMPELSWEFGYPTALGVMVLSNIYLWYRFKKSGWL
jgi:magnesium transporter